MPKGSTVTAPGRRAGRRRRRGSRPRRRRGSSAAQRHVGRRLVRPIGTSAVGSSRQARARRPQARPEPRARRPRARRAVRAAGPPAGVDSAGITSMRSSSISGADSGHSVGTGSLPVSECAPHPWSRLTTLPSSGDHSLAHTPKTVPERRPGAGRGTRTSGTRRRTRASRGSSGRADPRNQRSAASSRPCGREHPDARERELVDRDLVELGVARGRPAGLEARVVGAERQHVARADVAGAQPLGPRHPLGAEDRVVAGQQLGLAHGRDAAARHARHRDRPLPAAVAAGQGGEPVGDQALALDDDAEVLADVCGVAGQLDRDLTCEVDGRAEDGVLRGGGHVRPRGRRRRRAGGSRTARREPSRGSGPGAGRCRRGRAP